MSDATEITLGGIREKSLRMRRSRWEEFVPGTLITEHRVQFYLTDPQFRCFTLYVSRLSPFVAGEDSQSIHGVVIVRRKDQFGSFGEWI